VAAGPQRALQRSRPPAQAVPFAVADKSDVDRHGARVHARGRAGIAGGPNRKPIYT
jgi:hypothetical protein